MGSRYPWAAGIHRQGWYACFKLLPPVCCRSFSDLYPRLEGSLPAEGWVLPATITGLYLAQQSLSGIIPPGFKLVANSLTNLNLYGNLLSGSIPANLELPPTLQRLDLHKNRLTALLPAEMNLPAGLQELDVSDNALYGEAQCPGSSRSAWWWLLCHNRTICDVVV